jgi:cyanate permease
LGRTQAGIAVAVLTVAAIVGRLLLGAFANRLDVRWLTSWSLASQAAALTAMTLTTDASVLFIACAVFGLSAGNLITLPSLVIHREFDRASFGMLVGLSWAITQFSYAFGPGLLGVIRDATDSYTAPLLVCIALEIAAAALILLRPGRAQQAPVDFR